MSVSFETRVNRALLQVCSLSHSCTSGWYPSILHFMSTNCFFHTPMSQSPFAFQIALPAEIHLHTIRKIVKTFFNETMYCMFRSQRCLLNSKQCCLTILTILRAPIYQTSPLSHDVQLLSMCCFGELQSAASIHLEQVPIQFEGKANSSTQHIYVQDRQPIACCHS